MFKKGTWFKIGWLYLPVMFILEMILPTWTGDENGPIENLQMLWLFGGLYVCWKMRKQQFQNWGGDSKSLLYGGVVYFFLLIMREINWGRTLLTHPDGSYYEYSDMGLYGQMVHPMVGVLIIILLICLYRAKVWKFLQMVKIPTQNFVLLLLFIFCSWLGEKGNVTGFHGAVAEELAEFGAYMMMFRLLKDALQDAAKNKLD